MDLASTRHELHAVTSSVPHPSRCCLLHTRHPKMTWPRLHLWSINMAEMLDSDMRCPFHPLAGSTPAPGPEYLYMADKGPKLAKSCFVRRTCHLVRPSLRGRISERVSLVVVLRRRRFRAGREAIPVHLVSVSLRGFARRCGLVGIVPLVQLVVANRRDRVVLAAAGVCFPLRPRSRPEPRSLVLSR